MKAPPLDALLDAARAYLETEVAPQAEAIDQDPAALGRALDGLARHGLLGLRVPPQLGGAGSDAPAFWRHQEQVAWASGALAFLQTQHQSAAAMVAQGDNPALQRELLPAMARGERRVGIGFSQLRRPGPPAVRAQRDGTGYRLSGCVPWVTGAGFYREFLIGAALPDGSALFGLVPLEPEPGVRVGAAMRLAALEVAATVPVELEDWRLAPERVAFVRPPDWMAARDRRTVLSRTAFPLGCARAALGLLRQGAERRGRPTLRAGWEALDAELLRCRAAVLAGSSRPLEERLALRAWATELAVRCAQAAVAVSSGGANALAHPAQRVFREALIYTVLAQTAAVMDANVARLAGRTQEALP